MNSASRPLLFAALTIGMWGLWGFFGKLALDRRMAPTSIFLVEALTNAVLALPLVLFVLYRQSAPASQSTTSIYGFLSGAVLAVGLVSYYLALEEARASVIVPLTASYPVVATLLSYAFLGERPSFAQWIGVILVVIGGALLLTGPTK